MILSDGEILRAIDEKKIVIEPFDRTCLGTNSYDVHLSRHLAVYTTSLIDSKEDNKLKRFEIGEEGYVLYPGELYLGSTVEYTETKGFVPFLDGKSSIGRLGIDIHATAGKGDDGFCNHWTLELSVIRAVKVYPGMPIGQLTYLEIKGDPLISYDKKFSAKYFGRNPMPESSKMWMNF